MRPSRLSSPTGSRPASPTTAASPPGTRRLVARRFYEEIDHPVAGHHPVPGLPFRLSGVEHWLRLPAPTMGQHNHEILRELLGMTDAEIAALEDAEVIGTVPKGL